MSETTWEVTLGRRVSGTDAYHVVERANGRTHRMIARALTREEAYAVANSREATDALDDLWKAIHREADEGFDADRIDTELQHAFDVLMRAKGVRDVHAE